MGSLPVVYAKCTSQCLFDLFDLFVITFNNILWFWIVGFLEVEVVEALLLKLAPCEQAVGT